MTAIGRQAKSAVFRSQAKRRVEAVFAVNVILIYPVITQRALPVTDMAVSPAQASVRSRLPL
jgi:hypothetical protein